jgi:hypothetical protein
MMMFLNMTLINIKTFCKILRKIINKDLFNKKMKKVFPNVWKVKFSQKLIKNRYDYYFYLNIFIIFLYK